MRKLSAWTSGRRTNDIRTSLVFENVQSYQTEGMARRGGGDPDGFNQDRRQTVIMMMMMRRSRRRS